MSTTATHAAPARGEKITIANGKLQVPDQPVIPFIRGDGTGPDIWAASVRVMDAAVEKAYGGQKKILWHEVFAGQAATTGCPTKRGKRSATTWWASRGR